MGSPRGTLGSCGHHDPIPWPVGGRDDELEAGEVRVQQRRRKRGKLQGCV